jgi:hypothetical protein
MFSDEWLAMVSSKENRKKKKKKGQWLVADLNGRAPSFLE